ncbi:MAG: 50S ribosomal protein L37ae [Acidilobus sp.]|nr:50S ribosomal protein L37ae [Acidilobus sp.]MCG2889313.1 50S ribosomal protein L37ae [Acidilobus sp.]MCG2890705.1 50S ribosomal protein L37ae [Acidilobus sp.]
MVYSHTKVVGIAGRYGARYGSTLRKRVKAVLEKRYADHQCPFCSSVGTVKRVSTGIWKCVKCGHVWAGGAYVPRTELATYLPRYYSTSR